MTPETQGTKPRLIHRLLPFKRRSQNTETRPSSATHQNMMSGNERQPLNGNTEHNSKSEHESYMEYLTKAGKPFPQIASLSSENITPPVKAYVNQTYKEYLIHKENKNTSIQPEAPLPHGEPQSYSDYLTQTGRREVIIFHGETPTQAEKEYITQTYTGYLTQKYKGDMSEQAINYLIGLALQGNTPPPIIVDGKIMSGIEYWDYVQEKRQRQKQEKIARGELPDRNQPTPLVAQQLHFDETTQVTRRERNQAIITAIRGQFVTDLRNSDIDLIAENIRSDMWGYAGRVTRIRPAVEGKISIKDDGTVKNRLHSGLLLSYPLLNTGRHPEPHKEKTHELYVGVGYFGEDEIINIPREMQAVVTDEGRDKGFKAYFIRRTFFDEVTQKKKTYMTIIPFAYANSQRTFYEHLADSAIYLDPRKFISRRRARRYVKSVQAAA